MWGGVAESHPHPPTPGAGVRDEIVALFDHSSTSLSVVLVDSGR